jgi:hypothetical protein
VPFMKSITLFSLIAFSMKPRISSFVMVVRLRPGFGS